MAPRKIFQLKLEFQGLLPSIKCSKQGKYLVLGCKPQQLSQLPDGIKKATDNCLILSIMAGITLARLQQSFPHARNLVRSMPNTPGQIGQGSTGFLPQGTFG